MRFRCSYSTRSKRAAAFLSVLSLGAAFPAAQALAAKGTMARNVATATSTEANQKRECVMNQTSISGLSTFASMVGRQTIDCAMVYNAPSTWAQWASPWFIQYQPPSDLAWGGWVQSSPANDHRELVISQPLIPSGASGDPNWRAEGAAGDFTSYATQFAQNLVAAGVGDAIIRLSWEMNGNWFDDNIGSTSTDYANWVAFWRNTVLAMKAVPGAHFQFVWCINNGYRNIPFSSYYPGDDVVDIIGDDVYDEGVPVGENRWNYIYNLPGGLASLVPFANQHSKPIAIPEWGVGTSDPTQPISGPGGDDPSFVNGLAGVVKNDNVAFQSYFYAHGWNTELTTGPLSLAAYREHFGDGGDALGIDNGTDIVRTGQTTTSTTGSNPTASSAAPAKTAPSTGTAKQAAARNAAASGKVKRATSKAGRRTGTAAAVRHKAAKHGPAKHGPAKHGPAKHKAAKHKAAKHKAAKHKAARHKPVGRAAARRR